MKWKRRGQYGFDARSRDGFTLIETLLALAVIAILLLIALPRFQTALGRQSVRGSKNKLIGFYARARILAMQQGRTTQVRLNGNEVLITAMPRRTFAAGSTYDTVVAAQDLRGEYGVTVTPTLNPISINPRGYGTAEARLIMSKGDFADTLVISKYGRLLK